jgi:hypothetical protein
MPANIADILVQIFKLFLGVTMPLRIISDSTVAKPTNNAKQRKENASPDLVNQIVVDKHESIVTHILASSEYGVALCYEIGTGRELYA